MAGKQYAGTNDTPHPKDVAAYADGRRVAAGGGADTDDPHVSGSPASDAWLRGFYSWETGGTIVRRDNVAYPLKIVSRTGTATEDTDDQTGLTWDVDLDTDLPTVIDWGDESSEASADGAGSHTYTAEEDATYSVSWTVEGVEVATDDAEVTYPALSLDPEEVSIAPEATDDVTATVTKGGVGVDDYEVTAVSADTDVCTVAPASDLTAGGGDAVFTITGTVAGGITTVTFTCVATGEEIVCPVVVGD